MIWPYPYTLIRVLAAMLLAIASWWIGHQVYRKLVSIGQNSIEWQIRMYLRNFFLTAFLVLATLAMSDPRSGRKPVSGELKGLDIAIAFDVSRSMLVEDIKPNRLSNSISAIAQIVRALDDARFSIIPFKGDAAPRMPMTEDRVMLNLWMAKLGPGVSTAPGTNIEVALQVAMSTFPAGSGRNKIILLVTDGEALSGKTDRISRKLFESGISVHILLAGTPEGGTIPLGDGKNLMDKSNRPVISRADMEIVEQLANDTDGSVHLLSHPAAAAELIDLIQTNGELSEGRGIRFTKVYRYRLFLAPALLSLLLYLVARIFPWPKK